MLHFFCAIQTSDGGMEKKIRMEGAVESGGFVGKMRKSRILRESRNGGKPPRPGEPDKRKERYGGGVCDARVEGSETASPKKLAGFRN